MPEQPAMQRLVDAVGSRAASGADGVRPLGDLTAVMAHLETVEGRTHVSVWTMQRDLPLPAVRLSRELDERSHRKSVDERTILPAARARTRPLLTSVAPDLHLGPVERPLLVADGREVVLGAGDDGGAGTAWAWATDDPEVVALAVAAFEAAWERSRPWQEAGLRPPLPPRRFTVALALTDGLTDREIAEAVGVSARTVADEVRAVVEWLGARNRAHAIAMMVGAS